MSRTKIQLHPVVVYPCYSVEKIYVYEEVVYIFSIFGLLDLQCIAMAKSVCRRL